MRTIRDMTFLYVKYHVDLFISCRLFIIFFVVCKNNTYTLDLSI